MTTEFLLYQRSNEGFLFVIEESVIMYSPVTELFFRPPTIEDLETIHQVHIMYTTNLCLLQ